MDSPSQKLLDLVNETRKHLIHLHELGVEGIEPATPLNSRPLSPENAHVDANRRVTAPKPVEESTINKAKGLFGDLGPQTEKLPLSTETFEEIWNDVGDCTRCPLHRERTHVVHTEGNRRARLMFVGEAPGADEDAQARPFVGKAGQLLTKIIEAIGVKRDEVLIGNVNRCRPPGNRPPTPEEASMCKPFLLREIAVVQPEVIVVLGNTATKNLLDTREGITKLRGKFQEYKGIKVMPTFHPAYLLRDPSKKRETWEDLKKVRDFLDSSAGR
jgi:uracil-DNA glycosylase family 4